MKPQWVCSNCGNYSMNEAEAGYLMDARYANGYCPICSPRQELVPDKKNVGKWIEPARRVVQLIRADLYDPASLVEQKERIRRRKLISRYEKDASRLKPEELAEARVLVRLDTPK
jgi:hypothetical protein